MQRSELLPGSPRPRPQSDQDSAAFDQETAQLMENNMTMAMQYLQSKGLCLVPIGVASALSAQKGTSGAAAGIPTDLKLKTK